MKLKIIGSGCMDTKYNSASYLIDDNIAVDMPNGWCKNLKRLDLDLEKVEHVLITHFHGDHYFDLPFYFFAKNKKEKAKANIYADRIGIKKIEKIFKLAFPNSVRKVNKNMKLKYITSKMFTIDNYNVEKVLVDHGSFKPAFGYIITNNDIKLGFTGDTCYCDSVKELAKECQYLVCDCSAKVGDHKHMGIDNIIDIAEKHKGHKFIVSHMADGTRKEISKLKLENIIVPNDGDIIDII